MNPQNDTDTTPADAPLKPEFSRLASIADLSTSKTTIAFEATPEELAALTVRLGVSALNALNGSAILQILPNDDVLVTTTFKAHVKQHCGVTLDPIGSDISTSFTVTYSNEADEDWGLDEEENEDTVSEIEPLEPIVEGKIDLGEMCIEQLALEIDPFPRVQGATFNGYSAVPQGLTPEAFEKKNPFAVLSKLKTKQKNDD